MTNGKKIAVGVGVYLVAGMATALLLPSAKGLALLGKLEATALWPMWLYVYATGRAGVDGAGRALAPSPQGELVRTIDNGRPQVPIGTPQMRNVVHSGDTGGVISEAVTHFR